jgi:hypothetical protein
MNLTEKLLTLILTKMSNLVPHGGIWMNTQRPEWNDANNALVGPGLSVVTLGYLHRFLGFLESLFSKSAAGEFPVAVEIRNYLDKVMAILRGFSAGASVDDAGRKKFMDSLGTAASDYRNTVYRNGLSGERVSLPAADLRDFIRVSLEHARATLISGRREDGLYHAYNLLQLKADGTAGIRHLYEMLEGQVSILSSGLLSPEEASRLITKLKNSRLYRKDQNSYILYPDRDLKPFLDMNTVPADVFSGSDLAEILLKNGDSRILTKDVSGRYHFNGDCRNARILSDRLDELSKEEDYSETVNKEKESFLEIYEQCFDHNSFTGRSGTFFGYEGLGCIYWHMVSKLLLAVQENLEKAAGDGKVSGTAGKLLEQYYDIRSGIGFNKTPEVYGAFPADPYSHTPGHTGARQPGMTGQVKEEIITRVRELGIIIREGRISIDPRFLKKEEFSESGSLLTYIDMKQNKQEMEMPEKSLGFTFCQVPVVYTLTGDSPHIIISGPDGSENRLDSLTLSEEDSRAVFRREGAVSRIHVFIREDILA